MRRSVLVFLAFLLSLPAAAEDQALARLFARHGVDGTMVIASLYSGQTFIHNGPRASRRFPAASTFKILNTLIALEEHAISGKSAVLKWDGHRYDLPDWNRDQTLESAFRVSCVWCFQELARRVGAEKYRTYLHRSAYGALHEPFEVTTFWLDGALEISAIEQVAFLRQVYQRTLPFSASSYDALRQIMLVEQTPAFTLRAKTGWATRIEPHVGWQVGYVEVPGDVWFFAMNIEARDEKALPLRQQLTRAALQLKGVIE